MKQQITPNFIAAIKRKKLLVLGAICCQTALIWLIGAETASAAKSTVNGWLIRQSSRLQSEQEVSASSLGIKFVPRKGGLTYLFTPPFVNVQIWNQKTGKCCLVNLNQFHSQIQVAQTFWDNQVLQKIPLRKVKNGTFSGFATTEYQESEAFVKQQLQSFKRNEIPSRSAKSVTYIISNELKLNPIIYRCAARFYGLPFTGGMPLSFIYNDMDGDHKSHLVTGKITAQVFTERDFIMPADLKRVANEQQVAVSESYNEAIDIMLPLERTKH